MNFTLNDSATNWTCLPSAEDLLVVAVWSSLLSYGLVTNLLTLIGIVRCRTMRTSPSYWLILSVTYCDIMMIIISLTHLVPATIFHDCFVVVGEYRNKFAIFLYNVFWYSGVCQLAGMALNRYVSIVHSLYYRTVFTPCYTVLFLCFMYVLGVSTSLPGLFSCCYTIYDHQLWVAYYEDPESPYFIVDWIINAASLIVMIFCYAAILIKVRNSRASTRRYTLQSGLRQTYSGITSFDNNNSKSQEPANKSFRSTRRAASQGNSKREMKLLMQFFVVSLVFLLTFLTWQLLAISKWESKLIYFTTTTFFFINNAVNPTVYLLFNSALRRELKDFLCCADSKLAHRSASKMRENRETNLRNSRQNLVLLSGSS